MSWSAAEEYLAVVSLRVARKEPQATPLPQIDERPGEEFDGDGALFCVRHGGRARASVDGEASSLRNHRDGAAPDNYTRVLFIELWRPADVGGEGCRREDE